MEIGLRPVALARVNGRIIMRRIEKDLLLFGNRGSGVKPELGNKVLKRTGNDDELIFLLGVFALVKCHDAGRGIG